MLRIQDPDIWRARNYFVTRSRDLFLPAELTGANGIGTTGVQYKRTNSRPMASGMPVATWALCCCRGWIEGELSSRS